MKATQNLTGGIILIVLRIIIGGHLFFNGLVKIVNPDWSAKAYLEGSYGIFKWMASQGSLLNIIDLLNVWILLFAGLLLVLGMYERIASGAGTGLLILYYFAYPPFDILSSTGGTGPAFIVNEILIEIVALLVLFIFPTGKLFGIERLFLLNRSNIEEDQAENSSSEPVPGRREILKSLASIPFLAVFSIPFFQRRTYTQIDAITAATSLGNRDVFAREYERLKNIDLVTDSGVNHNISQMPYEKIGNLKVSRLIAGNSLISGNYGSRDLWYINRLADSYNSKDRILMTLKLMDTYGINTIYLHFRNFMDFNLQDYWTEEWKGKMQWIAEIYTYDINKFEHLVERNLMIGASAVCISPEIADKCIANNDFEYIPKAIEIMKKFAVPSGLGAYYNETIAFAIKEDLRPDFFYKSFHKDNYWSAHPKENRQYMELYKNKSRDHNSFYDNLWCDKPEAFAELMKNTDIPWVAFKTTAAGAIPFQESYIHAFNSGASFVSSSLFDFQVGDCVRSLRRAYQSI